MKDSYNGKEILITGGTGTLGKKITKYLLKENVMKGIRIFSRDEEKHRAFAEEIKKINKDARVSFLVGDIRDRGRLYRAMNNVDIVFHTAAMKQVPHCRDNPIEAVRTNIDGSVNVIDCAIDNLVQKVMLISTDKACYPVNLYGMTKAVAEKLFIHSGIYSPNYTKFSVCRYGNVVGSRGSVVKLFKEQYKKLGLLKVTDKRMTRFWIFIDDVVKFIISRILEMQGGEIFIPVIRSMGIIDLIDALNFGKNIEYEEIGVRLGEKLHECLFTDEESVNIIHSDSEFLVIKEGINTHEQCEYLLGAYYSNNSLEWNKLEFKQRLSKEEFKNENK